MPCSGLKSRTSVTSLGAVQQIDRRRAIARAAGVVGEEADALALQRGESVRAQHVDSAEHGHRRRRRGRRA